MLYMITCRYRKIWPMEHMKNACWKSASLREITLKSREKSTITGSAIENYTAHGKDPVACSEYTPAW